MELRSRTAIVMGASRGLGVYIARALAAEGMRLALSARTAEPIAGSARADGGVALVRLEPPRDRPADCA